MSPFSLDDPPFATPFMIVSSYKVPLHSRIDGLNLSFFDAVGVFKRITFFVLILLTLF